MSKQTRYRENDRRGSIYLVVLVVVAAVSTMILVGTSLRRTTAEQYRAIDDRARVRQGVRSATEAALAYMDDMDTFIGGARAGKAYSETVGKSTITVSAVDKDTLGPATDSTTTLLVTATAETTAARSLISFDADVPLTFLQRVLAKGATSYWPLNEPENSAGPIDQISAINGTYYTPSIAGKDKSIDKDLAPRLRTIEERIELPHDRSFEVSSGTILFWGKLKDMSSSNEQALFSKEDNDTVDFDVAMFIQNSEVHLKINSKYSFLDRHYAYNIADKNDKKWHHFAYSFGSGGTRIYVDGKRIVYDSTYTIGLSYSYLTFSERNNERWWLGARRDESDPSAPIEGNIARFVFIPNQLADDEIAELMDAQLSEMKLLPVDGSFARVIE